MPPADTNDHPNALACTQNEVQNQMFTITGDCFCTSPPPPIPTTRRQRQRHFGRFQTRPDRCEPLSPCQGAGLGSDRDRGAARMCSGCHRATLAGPLPAPDQSPAGPRARKTTAQGKPTTRPRRPFCSRIWRSLQTKKCLHQTKENLHTPRRLSHLELKRTSH